MQPIHIFRAGRHTSAAGEALEFSEDALRESARAYDPALHEAPIVIGHPRDNGPAYGWVGAVHYADGGLHAEPKQVDADFAELVRAGRYKKVSASFYTPDAPANPVPGTYYLRHVGFLGAQPPAIKGLKQASFADGDAGVVEFSGEWETAGFFRRFREWFIDKFSREEADKVIPAYMVEGMEQRARDEMQEAMAPVLSSSSFAEHTMQESAAMNADQIAALEKRAAEAEAALAARAAEFAEREQRLAEAERAQRQAHIAGAVDALVSDGRVLPAQRAGLVAFMQALPAETVVEFGEGEVQTKQGGEEYLLSFLRSLPKAIDFAERAPREQGEAVDANSADDIARRAVEFQEAQAKTGRRISTAEAVAAVIAGRAA